MGGVVELMGMDAQDRENLSDTPCSASRIPRFLMAPFV